MSDKVTQVITALSIGDKYPYDGDDDNHFVPAAHWTERAARAVIADLCDRRDIKRGFDDVDLDIRREIVTTLADIINKAYEDGLPK